MATELTEEQALLLETWAGKGESGEISPDEDGNVALSELADMELHQCHICEKVFTSQKHVRHHLKKTHFSADGDLTVVSDGKRSSGASYQCHVCQVSLTSKWHYLRHYKRIHTDEFVTSRKRTITCPVCRVRVQNMTALSDHIGKCHPEQGIAEQQTLEFCSKEEFEKWKTEEERRSVSAFIQRRGMDKHNVIRYYCRRSGVYVTRGVGKRQTKSQGSCKVGSTCPAYIKAAFTPTGVTVTYSFVHVGHDADLKHIDLSSEERHQIAAMIAAGIPFNDILAQVRENVPAGTLSRLHLIQRRDLNNIARDFRLTNAAVRRSEDGTTLRKPRGRPPAAAPPPAVVVATPENDLSEIDSMITFIRGSLETGDRSVIANAMEGLKSVTTQVQAALHTAPKTAAVRMAADHQQGLVPSAGGSEDIYADAAGEMAAASNPASEMYVDMVDQPGAMYINEVSSGLDNGIMINAASMNNAIMLSADMSGGSAMGGQAGAMYVNALNPSSAAVYMTGNHSTRGVYIMSSTNNLLLH